MRRPGAQARGTCGRMRFHEGFGTSCRTKSFIKLEFSAAPLPPTITDEFVTGDTSVRVPRDRGPSKPQNGGAAK